MSFSQLVLATRNQDKVLEIKTFFRDLGLAISSAANFPQVPEVKEDQHTLHGNALKKAHSLAQVTGLPSLADDTGLEVDALDGRPGVYSSRYAGEKASYADNVDKLLAELQDVPEEKRTARFRCVMALIIDSREYTVEGICEGQILHERRGVGGFGYDPVFWVPSFGKTFAEITLEEKNLISHRGIALRKIHEVIQDLQNREQ